MRRGGGLGCIYIGGGITWGRGQAKEGKQNKEGGGGANRPRVPLGLGLERGRRRPGAAPGARAGWGGGRLAGPLARLAWLTFF